MLKIEQNSNPFVAPAPIDRIIGPIRRLLAYKFAAGGMLIASTATAFLIANCGWGKEYHDFWETPLTAGIGWFKLDRSLHFWVNDAVMTLFFFVVGLEIKREMVHGELRSARKAILPVVAALGGMIVPATIFLIFQWGQPGVRGWGIPTATDIAFAIGILTLFGQRVPVGLKIFLLTLAIVDDVGAILVIAVAYSQSIEPAFLASAAAGILLVVVLSRLGVRSTEIYFVIGGGIWLAIQKSGIHPTVAGVVLGLLTPSTPRIDREQLRKYLAGLKLQSTDEISTDEELAELTRLRWIAKESKSPLDRLELQLHDCVAFVIMPLFALANAGVEVRGDLIRHSTMLAVACGLVLGKPVGIFLFGYAAVKAGWAELPSGTTWRMILAAGFLGGIGFTMSLFITGLAFKGPDSAELEDAGKLGTLVGSTIAAVLGCVLLARRLPKAK